MHDWSSKNDPILQIESEFAKKIVNSKSITLLLLHNYILGMMTLIIQVTMIRVKTKWIQRDFAQQKVFKMVSRMKSGFRVDSKWINEKDGGIKVNTGNKNLRR